MFAAAGTSPCHAERSEASGRPSSEILRSAQDDKRGDVLDPSRSQGGHAGAAGSPKVPANCVILVVYISRVLHSYSGYFYEELCD